MKLSLPKNFLSAIVLICVLGHGSAFSITGLDLLNSGLNLISGVGSELTNLFPTVKELFSATKQVLFGLPEQALFKIINELCSVYVASDKVEPRIKPQVEQMFLQLRTPCKNITVPLRESEKLLDVPEFDVNKKVVIFITGWMSSITSDYIDDMAKAYNCRGGYNFLALNTSDFVQTLFSWSALNTEEVGALVAKGLVKLAQRVPVENIHLIGHSLGAHMVGKAGREFTNLTGKIIPRITGLDPANPCYNQGESLSGLYRGDAAFVDVIHSNPGVLGKLSPIGDADFYPEGLGPIKPGCVIFSCSHSRAYEYYTESVYPAYERNFLAKRCNSLKSLNDGYCKGPDYPMGFATPSNIKGDYFLSVNGQAPFGKNLPWSSLFQSSTCGRCKQ